MEPKDLTLPANLRAAFSSLSWSEETRSSMESSFSEYLAHRLREIIPTALKLSEYEVYLNRLRTLKKSGHEIPFSIQQRLSNFAEEARSQTAEVLSGILEIGGMLEEANYFSHMVLDVRNALKSSGPIQLSELIQHFGEQITETFEVHAQIPREQTSQFFTGISKFDLTLSASDQGIQFQIGEKHGAKAILCAIDPFRLPIMEPKQFVKQGYLLPLEYPHKESNKAQLRGMYSILVASTRYTMNRLDNHVQHIKNEGINEVVGQDPLTAFLVGCLIVAAVCAIIELTECKGSDSTACKAVGVLGAAASIGACISSAYCEVVVG